MAFQRAGQHDQSMIADTKADLAEMKHYNMGSTCWVIETAEKYMANSKGEWVLQTLSTNGHAPSSGGGNADMTGYATIQYSDAKDAATLDSTDEHIAAVLSNGQSEDLNTTVNTVVEEIVSNMETGSSWNTIPEN